MGRWSPRIVLLLLALVAVTGASAGPWASSELVVKWVTDGDTLTLESGQHVRLLQVDAPEVGSRECYAWAAKWALVRLVPAGTRIVLETDPELDRMDRFGRLLRYVKRGRTNVNVALVRAGAAAPYFLGRERGKYASRLLAVATRAKAAKRGLWRACPRAVLDPDRALDTGG